MSDMHLTPWLSACEAIRTGLDWLTDIHKIKGHDRTEALAMANHAFDRAEILMGVLASPQETPHAPASCPSFQRTLAHFKQLTAPIRAQLNGQDIFRYVPLRDMALQAHPHEREAEAFLAKRRA